jgi:hypothetical protein
MEAGYQYVMQIRKKKELEILNFWTISSIKVELVLWPFQQMSLSS